MMRFVNLWTALTAATVLFGCGDGAGETTGGAGGGAGAGSGGGQPDVGPRAYPCLAGELEVPSGCQPAGVPSGGCGDGFVNDGDAGCMPVLPAAPCPSGMMALPGEMTCRLVAPCGPGPWGTIPVEVTTEHVDGAYTGGSSDGSATAPWITIQAGIDAALAGAIVAVAPGNYAESLAIAGKSVRLWGKCPSEVSLSLGNMGGAVVFVRAGADGTELRGLSIAGAGTAVLIENATGVLIHQSWIHDMGWIGLYVYPPQVGASASAMVRESLIERATSHGAYAFGADLELLSSVVRDTQPMSTLEDGLGILVFYDEPNAVRPALLVSHSIVEASREAGMFVLGGDATIEDTVVSDTLPRQSDMQLGIGIQAAAYTSAAQPTELALRRSVVTGNRTCGLSAFDSNLSVERATLASTTAAPVGFAGAGVQIFAGTDLDIRPSLVLRESIIRGAENYGVGVVGSDAVIAGTVVKDVVATIDAASAGAGITLEPQPARLEASAAEIDGVLIEHTMGVGVGAVGASLVARGVLVRHVESNPTTGAFGRGISVETEPTTQLQPSGTLENCVVDDVQEIGIDVLGGDASITSTSVRGVRPSDAGLFGVGILMQVSIETGQRTTGTVSWSLVEDVHLSGLHLAGADVTVEGSRVTRVLAHPDLGDFGDGIVGSAVIYDPNTGAHDESLIEVSGSVVEGNVRAGISSFGAAMNVGGSFISCNGIDLNGEPFYGVAFSFIDLGGNVCGCGAPALCQVLSSNLAAPPVLGD